MMKIIDDRTVEEVRGEVQVHLAANLHNAPASMIEACMEAIQAYWDDENEKLIQLPQGVQWRELDAAPAHAICDGFRLEQWTWHYDYDVAADERMMNGYSS